jgi:hypothetical protein
VNIAKRIKVTIKARNEYHWNNYCIEFSIHCNLYCCIDWRN